MSILTHTQLTTLVNEGAMEHVEPSLINPASIDVRLGSTFFIEDSTRPRVIDLSAKESPPMIETRADDTNSTITLHPGDVLLACTIEVFHMPDDVAGMFVLKSTPARAFLNHMKSGWIDPGFNGSPLTLQLKNELAHSHIKLKVGMPIGQVVFWRGEEVPPSASYAVKGHYNRRNGAARGHHA
jgi:dCTP deaminase